MSEEISEMTADPAMAEQRDVQLAPEFLRWLWYKCEEDGRGETGEGQPFHYRPGDRMTLVGTDPEKKEKVSLSGKDNEMAEGKLAMAKGKMINSFSLVVSIDDNEWILDISAPSFAVKMKTPAVSAESDEDDPDSMLLEKMYLIDQGMQCLDALYSRFVELRTSPEWAEEERAIRQWVEAGQE